MPRKGKKVKQLLDYLQVKEAIAALKTALMQKEEASDLFGQERGEQLQGILGSIKLIYRRVIFCMVRHSELLLCWI